MPAFCITMYQHRILKSTTREVLPLLSPEHQCTKTAVSAYPAFTLSDCCRVCIRHSMQPTVYCFHSMKPMLQLSSTLKLPHAKETLSTQTATPLTPLTPSALPNCPRKSATYSASDRRRSCSRPSHCCGSGSSSGGGGMPLASACSCSSCGESVHAMAAIGQFVHKSTCVSAAHTPAAPDGTMPIAACTSSQLAVDRSPRAADGACTVQHLMMGAICTTM